MSKNSHLPHKARIVVMKADPTLGPHIISTVDKWIRDSGPEWTANRVKSIWNAALHSRAGNTDLAVQVYQEQSIAYCKVGSLVAPKGVWGALTVQFLKAERPQVLKRLATVFRIYTSIFLKALSPKQIAKARESITGQPTKPMESCAPLRAFVRSHARELGIPRQVNLSRPDITKLRPYTYVYSPTPLSGKNPAYAKLINSLVTSPYSPYYEGDRYKPDDPLTMEGFMPPNVREFLQYLPMSFPEVDIDHPGRIWFIQEAGCKGRVVAQPCASIQFALQPVQEFLATLIRSKEECCVYDQNRGAYFSMRAMNLGIKTYCFDLSSATDRFPLWFQQDLLDLMGLESVSATLEQLSKDPWLVPQVNDEETWSYNTGQPMGVVLSFPLFSLAHWTLIKSLELALEEKGNALTRVDGKTFMTVGDDVIIVDPLVAKAYHMVMTLMGVEINPLKSQVSDTLCEFAGFLTIKTSRSVACFRPYKYDLRHKPSQQVNLYASIGNTLSNHKEYQDTMLRFSLSRGWRNPDLSPLIKADEPGGILPDIADESSVEQLILIYWSPFNRLPEEGFLVDLQKAYARELLGKVARESPEKGPYKDNFFVGMTDEELDKPTFTPAPTEMDPLLRDFPLSWDDTPKVKEEPKQDESPGSDLPPISLNWE